MRHLFVFFGLVFLFNSCGNIYKCGEDRPERFAAGNRLMEVVNERDELCQRIGGYEEENVLLRDSVEKLNDNLISLYGVNQKLNSEIVDLKEANGKLFDENQALTKEQIELQKKYSNLFTDSYTQGHLFNERLKVKEQQLADKERMLLEKESLLLEREAAIRDLKAQIAQRDSIAKRLDELLRKALLGFNSDELTVEIKNGKVYVSMSDKLLFKSGSANVESKGKEAISILAKVLNSNADFDILVEGHTDNVPIKTAVYKDNWDLSVARATSIVRILTSDYAMDPIRLTASGKGEFSPRASNDDAQGRASNRRTEIVLSPRLEELMEMLSK